jgi:hypothetical protein
MTDAAALRNSLVREDPLMPPDAARLAVLIDSDNTTASLTTELLEEIAKFGTPTVKRAYGDWTTPQLSGWKEELLRHAIQLMQQFASRSRPCSARRRGPTGRHRRSSVSTRPPGSRTSGRSWSRTSRCCARGPRIR